MTRRLNPEKVLVAFPTGKKSGYKAHISPSSKNGSSERKKEITIIERWLK